MNQNYLRDQRGVAMVLELVLVAVVLGLVGVAVYQVNHRATTPTASVSGKAPAVNSAEGLANSAAAITESSAADDASLSASAESSAGDVTDTDVDITNLGGSTSENSY